jgi:hypothetical protein
MSERSKPYVGVGGIVNELRVEPSGVAWRNPQDLLLEGKAADAGLFEAGYGLALAVNATYVTQWWRDRKHRRDQDFTYPNEWYPVGEKEFASALHPKGHKGNVMGVAQAYAGPHPYEGNAEHYQRFIDQVMYRGRQWITAVQFDGLRWYENNDAALQFVAEMKRKYSSQDDEQELITILSVNREAMKELQPNDVVHRLGRYATAINYVIFDASGGEGRRMYPDVMDDYLDAAYSAEQLDGVGFAVAGGLTPDAVKEDLPYLVQKYPGLSWELDQVKSHPRSNIGKYSLQMDMAKDFIDASVETINQQ